MRAVTKGHRIYLTGNPGDGKTHLIRKFENELKDAQALTHLDASAADEDRLVERITEAVDGGRSAVIAVNEGPLRKMVARLPETERAAIRQQLDHPFLYGSEEELQLLPLVVNLGARQLLIPDVIAKVVDLTLNRVDYAGAPEGVLRNVKRLEYDRVQQRLLSLLVNVGRTGQHFTMHQLLSFFSYIVTGSFVSSTEIAALWDLVFSSENPLAPEIGDFDPAVLSHPLIDRLLWDGDPNGEIEWIENAKVDPAPRMISGSEEALASYSSWKRRFYFEALSGDVILEMLPTDRRRFLQVLEESATAGATSKAKLLRALSFFYGDPAAEDQGEKLEIWTGLRYEALGPPTAYTSSISLAKEDLSLLLPRLRPQIADLIEYSPDHVRLAVPTAGSDVGLTLDLDVWLALMKIKRGMPQRYHDPIVGRRLEEFMSRIAAGRSDRTEGYARLKIRDVEQGHTYLVDVSVEQRRYRL